jgi:hypothetical protein
VCPSQVRLMGVVQAYLMGCARAEAMSSA